MTPLEIQKAVNMTAEQMQSEARQYAKEILEGTEKMGFSGQKIEDHEDAAAGIAEDFTNGYMVCLQKITGLLGVPAVEVDAPGSTR